LGVVGGFNLDNSVSGYAVGAIIPTGSIAEYDESTRLVKVLKAARVKAIDGVDAKIVTLDTDFIPNTFKIDDSVVKDVAGTFAGAPVVKDVDDKGANTVITLSAAIGGLVVGDALFQVVDDGGDAALEIANPNGVTIAGQAVIGTEVKPNYTGVDVTADTKGYMYYTRRIPPIPAAFREGNHLKGNPNILLTDSR
jgi:hypothetical protein